MSNSLPAFSLSDDSSIEAVLTDIPFFCVGLMAFGVLTFVLFMKRIDLIAIYLYISSFIAFVAAVLDLSQTLVLGKNGSLGPVTASGLTIAREVGLALSVGFLYVFLWCLVAQCPRGEQPTSFIDIKGKSDYTDYTHSASWTRWGLLGLLLKWGLLGLSLSIPVLQIVWRVSVPDSQFGTTYISEATIEVVVSALFILKLFLNIFLSPLIPWWLPIQMNVAPTIALLISGGLGIGNLSSFAFSESILGRFLRAVEVYILILFVLIVAFHNPPLSRTFPDSLNLKELQSNTAWEKPNGLTFTLGPQSLHRMVPTPGPRPTVVNKGDTAIQSSMRSRLSSSAPSHDSRRIESGGRPYTPGLDVAYDHASSLQSDTETSSMQGGDVGTSFAAATTDTSNIPKLDGDQVSITERPFTAFSIPSYYAMAQDFSTTIRMPAPISAHETDSPVYGLNGIMNRARAVDVLQSRRDSSMSTFDALLRQQTELDKSIVALRLFSSGDAPAMVAWEEAHTPVPGILLAKTENSTSKARSASVSTLSYLGRKPDSASNRSEFSLSFFPEPPVAYADPPTPTNKRNRFTQTLQVDAPNRGLSLIKVPKQETSSPPVSFLPFEQNGRSDSAVTQYDVTSFIGDLSIPITSGAALPSSNPTNGTILNEVEFEDVLPHTATFPNTGIDTTGLQRRALESSIPTVKSPELIKPITFISSVAAGPLETSQSSRREPSNVLRPLLLGTPSPTTPLILPSSTKVPMGPRRKNRGLPSNPRRPVISGPLIPSQDRMGSDVPGAFERPRPPPWRFVAQK
ncbi:hypothetical protein BDZ94DRAFT_1276115 [Collybia nuda]|uniref:Transmembrane protein n=1 Tax=Collybia nuda TaxID=64659 RepID=A0A9P5XV43_9AGAR|nr:hypothetical protein BDZ94DRAFT_1276115 [Collybia nuda]